MFNHILIATDGSKLAEKAIEQGLVLAKALKAKVTAVTVTEPFPVFAIDPQTVTDTPGEYQTHARQHAEHGNPYEAIIKTAGAQGCDVIVMASHGHRGVAGLLLGSQTMKVLTHSRIPVLVCR